VVNYQLGNHAQSRRCASRTKETEFIARAVLLVDIVVVGYVVAIVPSWGGIEGQQPDGVDAQVLNVIELAGETSEIAHAASLLSKNARTCTS